MNGWKVRRIFSAVPFLQVRKASERGTLCAYDCFCFANGLNHAELKNHPFTIPAQVKLQPVNIALLPLPPVVSAGERQQGLDREKQIVGYVHSGEDLLPNCSSPEVVNYRLSLLTDASFTDSSKLWCKENQFAVVTNPHIYDYCSNPWLHDLGTSQSRTFMTTAVFNGHMIAVCLLHNQVLASRVNEDHRSKITSHGHMMSHLMTGKSLNNQRGNEILSWSQ